MTSKKDKLRGCLVGGAIGDALGYAVEFPREPQIFSRYRKNGIIEYELDNRTVKALISDDTQMTLFTATGIMAQSENGVLYDIVEIIDRDYLSCFDDPKTFHVSTIRKKLNEFVTIGLLQTEKQGKTLYYQRKNNISFDNSDVLHFFSEASPCGVVGSFILDRCDADKEILSFKHHYIYFALDSEIVYSLFEAMHNKQEIEISKVTRKGEQRSMKIVPLRIFISVGNGRQYLMAYRNNITYRKTAV